MLLVTRRVFAVTAVAAMILVLAAGLPAQEGQQQQLPGGYRWTKAAPFPEPQEELYGLGVNGKIYVIGGFGPGGVPPGLMYEYDPATDKWTKKKSMPIPVHHQAQATYQGKIYIFGGCLKQLVGESTTDNTWVFDPDRKSTRLNSSHLG